MSKKKWSLPKPLKLIVLYGTIFAIVYNANKYVSRSLLQIRSSFEHMPIGLVWPVWMLVNILRISVILPFYMLPLGSFIMWYFMVTLGVETAAVILICSWIIQVLIYIPSMRKLWTRRITIILESKKNMWWFPEVLKRGILAIDLWWKDWAKSHEESGESRGRTIIKRAALVYIMETTWFAGGIVPEVWLATRTVIPWYIFAPAVTVAYWLLYPWTKTFGRAMVEVSFAEEGNLMHEFIMKNIEGVHLLSWWEILFAGMLPLGSTLFVHGQHMRIFVLWIRRWYRGEKDVKKTEPTTDQENIKLHPKEEVEVDRLTDRWPESSNSPSLGKFKVSEITLVDYWDNPLELEKKKH